MVVVRLRHIPLFGKDVAHAEHHIVPIEPGAVKAPHARLGIQACTYGILAVKRADAPYGIVEVFKHKPAVHKLVERGGQLRVNGKAGEAFRRNHDEIIVFKHPGILVFVGGPLFTEILVQVDDIFIRLFRNQPVKVNLHHIRRRIDRFRFLRFVRRQDFGISGWSISPTGSFS